MTETLPLVILSPILVASAYCDLRYMRIPNSLVLAALALFVATTPILGLSELGWRLGAAAIVFSAGFIAFSMRLFGGGDVKMLASLMLFIPSTTMITFGYVFSLAMFVGVLTTLLLQNVPWAGKSTWESVNAKGSFPMGISIASAGVMHPFVVMANLSG